MQLVDIFKLKKKKSDVNKHLGIWIVISFIPKASSKRAVSGELKVQSSTNALTDTLWLVPFL